MNFRPEHIERIKELGYTDSEARFLYIVAVHSGYFTLGQFLAFTHSHYGKRTTSFTQKLLKQGHATVRDYLRRGSIFHLFSRIVYGQIEKDNLRNRKKHSFDFMRARLVLLDFILANQELTYLETEEEKVRFFLEDLDISKDALPAKVYEGASPLRPTLRYFVDKFPLFLAPPFAGAPPVVTFSYVDSGFESISNFIGHLGAYRRLFRQLKSFRFVYIAVRDAFFEKARERFRAAVAIPLECDMSGEVLRYFEIRAKWEQHAYVVPVTEDFELLNEGRLHFHGDRFETLYQSWAAGKLSVQELRREFSQMQPRRRVFFDTFLVSPHGTPLQESVRRRDGCAKSAHHPRVFSASLKAKNKDKEEEIMSIINKPPELVKREFELQEPIAAAVEKYATFIQSTPDHVVNSALKMVIWRDVEFRHWLKQQQNQADSKDGTLAKARA
jgi:hypothetical protein